MNEQAELTRDMVKELTRLEEVFHEANAEQPRNMRDIAIISAMMYETIHYARSTLKLEYPDILGKLAMSITIHESTEK
jgi:hypothetical protein